VFATKSAVARLVLTPSREVSKVTEFPDPRSRNVWRPSAHAMPVRSLLTRSIIVSRPDLASVSFALLQGM
jgi:hypothetical protein